MYTPSAQLHRLASAAVALASLLNPRLFAGLAGFPNFAPKAKRVIYLIQSGAPSQFELLDHKPALAKAHGEVLGSEFFGGQRLTGMTSGQKEKKVCKSIYNFSFLLITFLISTFFNFSPKKFFSPSSFQHFPCFVSFGAQTYFSTPCILQPILAMRM